MADTFRYQYGETNPVQVPVSLNDAIAIGDLCYQDAADSASFAPAVGPPAKSANSYPWQGSLSATQTTFVANFIGVSGQRWDGTNLPTGSKDGTIRIATTGVYLFDCAIGSSFNLGDLLGPDNAGSLSLLPQQLIKVTTRPLAVARCVKSVVSASKVLVMILPTLTGEQLTLT